MNDIQPEQLTHIERINALMQLVLDDDSDSLYDLLRRIHREIKNFSITSDKEFTEKMKEIYASFEPEHIEMVGNVLGKEESTLYLSTEVFLFTIILFDPKSVPSPKDLTKIYSAFVPRLQISNGFDLKKNIKNQWKSKVESASDDFIRKRHENAAKSATSDDRYTHLQWECNSNVLKFQVHTILYGNVSPQFCLHDNMNLNISSLRTLRPKSLISDFIVSHFSELVKTEDEHAFYKVYHVSDHELKKRNSSNSYWEKKFNSKSKIKLGTKKLILLFPRCNNAHFTVHAVFLDQPTNNAKIRVEEYNSLRTSGSNTDSVTGKSYEQDLSELYMKFLHSQYHCENFDISSDYEIETDIRHLECPQQKNGYDCGVFCILYLCSLTGSIPLDLFEINQEYIDSNHVRNWILASIISKRILLPSYKSYESDENV